mgnify:CR=1 FL=1
MLFCLLILASISIACEFNLSIVNIINVNQGEYLLLLTLITFVSGT